ncbi:MAG: penicillin-binding protein 1A [Gammaproteobacteria bacterium]|nr:penicillin-binding protein 1A [Gammaproteobacteria bacterium]NCW56998.1 penicillin-binding protein 1A [Gammaproteobacteria bacterium]NDB25474.1 penicillin-binding protein 1A [Gammaproteobacteria bacterium]NDE86483.1 penicillin-binding protein 1A [Gammaproteobacteria bacterium]
MKRYLPKIAFLAAAGLVIGVIGVMALISGAYLYLQPSLPSVEAMRQIELQVPLRVYSRDGQVIAQIGEQRRIPVTFEQVPPMVRQAFIAAEDDRFFEHSGFDYQGILRSMMVNLLPGYRLEGASTITQQTAKNLFLTNDRTWRRKGQEMFLTYRIEQEFSKEEILGLYLNVIHFGKRAYGVAAAADLYFGKTLDQLTLAEAATLARVPQAPSRFNPINNPTAAAQRRTYVLRRMRELGFIDTEAERRAAAEKIFARVHVQSFEVEAPYVAEMARLELVQRFGAAAQNEGYKIYTTIEPVQQGAANEALRTGLLDYDRRHGWRGARATVSIPANGDEAAFEELLEEQPVSGGVLPALVLEVQDKSARVYARGSGIVTLPWEGISWARPKVNGRLGKSPKSAREILARGQIIHVTLQPTPQLAQIPEAAAALVALSPADGAITALVGGFDYFDVNAGKFNRAIQAKRQPGSGYKPFLYSAALENGFTPSSLVLDAPFVIDDPRMEEAWRPENSSGDFGGPTRLREALVKSRNLVSIRVLQAIGMGPAMAYTERFGFDRASLPRNLTLSLGTMSATPLQVAAGYAVFANGGHRIQPWFIERIVDPQGQVVFEATPRRVARECDPPEAITASETPAIEAATAQNADAEEAGEAEALPLPTSCKLPATQVAPRVISSQNAWLITDMLRDVITRGTGRRALALGRSDVAGKTGTTNEARDTWFNGYNPTLVASVWVGFDQLRPLGEGEEGSRTAVPIWTDFMAKALKGVPDRPWPVPGGLVQVRISPVTGEIASADDPDAIFETFMTDRLPTGGVLGEAGMDPARPPTEQPSAEPIF